MRVYWVLLFSMYEEFCWVRNGRQGIDRAYSKKQMELWYYLNNPYYSTASNEYIVSEVIESIEKLVNEGRYFEARAAAEVALHQSDELRLTQLYALAMSKAGNPTAAMAYLNTLAGQTDDAETAGILGGIYKDLFKKFHDNKYAILSRDTYLSNFSKTNNYYTGINAATMSAIAGKVAQGREIAQAVIQSMNVQTTSLWEQATLAEAYLLTKNRELAIEYYIKARKSAGKDWGKVLSIHNQLWLLNNYLPVPKEVTRIFAPPVVVAFTGHMVDAGSRATSRFPASIESTVKESIRSAVKTLQAGIGYCSLACGSDILFAEVMAEEGGEVHVIMPFGKEDFINTSVRFAGEPWVERFEKLLACFPRTMVTLAPYGGNDDLFALLGKVIFGAAILRSQTYHAEPYLLTVLSEYDLKRREGGTRDTLQSWPFQQRHTNINPDQFITSDKPGIASLSAIQEHVIIPNRPVLFLAYFDFSGLVLMEQEHIEKQIKSLAGAEQPAFKIYERLTDAVVIGLDSEIRLLDIVRSVWNSVAPFKPEKPLRVTLHAGPIHVPAPKESVSYKSLCAMSKLASKGTLYASEGMASVLALYPRRFQLDYAGVITLDQEELNHGLYQLTFKD